ncbi:MAG: RidA family protein [Alphaproteobacteria bacterium]|nr:RidA family protein [Alphaproteobacteria bacterium]
MATIERHFPAGLFDSRYGSYAHVVTARGGRHVFVAGQVALDAARNLVGGGDLAAQTRQALANVATALAAVGAAPKDIVKVTIFVARYRYEYRDVLFPIFNEFFGEALPANSLIGVETLARPEFLIEIEAIAVTD